MACCRRALAASSCALAASRSGLPLQQLGRLTRTRRRNGWLDGRRRDARCIERLVSNEHGDAMPRDGSERFERRYRRACPRGFRLRTLDVERRRETDPLARRYEAQRFVLRGGYRTHRFELAQRAGEREVVGCNVTQHQQTHASRAVFDGQRLGRGRSGARAQATEEVDFPCHADADLRRPRIRRFRNEVLENRVVVRLVIEGGAAHVDARKQPRAADRLSGARGAQPLGRDLDVAVLLRCAADEVGKHRILEAFPPRHLGLVCGGRRCREPVRHIERGLQHGCGTPRQRERERRREYTQMAEWDAGGGWVRHGSERKGTVAASRQRSVDVLSGFRRKARRGFTCGRVST